MDRSTWLADRQANAEAYFDVLRAPTDPDDDWVTQEHLRFVDAVVESCPPAGLVLDAACGTGTFFGRILETGRSVIGYHSQIVFRPERVFEIFVLDRPIGDSAE